MSEGIDLESVRVEHEVRGARRTFHGFAYQILTIIHYMKSWLEKGGDFKLATEVEGVGVFDDIVILDENQAVFGQVKHTRTKAPLDLWSEKGLSLPALFVSYLKIRENEDFRLFSERMKFFVYTNRNLDIPCLRASAGILDSGYGQWFKLGKKDREDLLRKTLTWVAKGLLTHLQGRQPKGEIGYVFKHFCCLLQHEKIIDSRRLHKNFIEDLDLSIKAKAFREIFSSEILKVQSSWDELVGTDIRPVSSGGQTWPGMGEVEDFSENFFLGVDQLDEETLSRKLLRNLTWDSVHRRITQWFSKERGTYLSREDCENILKKIKVAGDSEAILQKLDSFGTTFDNTWPLFDKFMMSEEILLTLQTVNKTFTSSRVVSKLRELGKTFFLGTSSSFLEVKTLVEYEVYILEVDGNDSWVMPAVNSGKVVILTEGESKVGSVLRDDPLLALDGKTKRRILEKKVNFQGAETQLGDLILSPDDLGEALTLEVLRSNDINLGEVFKTKEYYINRRFLFKPLQPRTGGREKEKIKIFSAEDLASTDPCLISDAPGSGKSYVLDEVAVCLKRKRPNDWVVRVSLDRCTASLRALRDDKGEPRQLFVRHFVSGDLEKRLISVALERDRVCILFDGLDEVKPLYKEALLDMIASLGKDVFLTTRPHLREEICNKMAISGSFSFLPFTGKEQLTFMIMYLNEIKTEVELKEELLKEFTLDILENPFMLRVMLDYVKSGKIFLKPINQYTVLENLVQEKFAYYTEKTDPDGLGNRAKFFLRLVRDRHRKLGLEVSLGITRETEDENEDLDSELPQFGFLDSNINFFHRYYSDFFTAELFVGRRLSAELEVILQEVILLKPEHAHIRSLLNGALEEREKKFSVDPKIVTEEGWTALHVAAKEHLPNLVKSIADSHLLEVRDSSMCTPLLLASLATEEFTTLIYDLHSNLVEIVTNNNKINSYVETVRTLLDLGSDPNVVDQLNNKPIRPILKHGLYDLYCYMMEKSTTVDKEDVDVFHSSFGTINIDIVKDLVEARGLDWDLESLLRTSVSFGNLELTKYLLQRGVNTDNWDVPILHRAAASGNKNLVKFLVEDCHIELDGRDLFDRSVIHLAALAGDMKTFRYLLEKGCDPYQVGKYKMTLLHSASEGRNLEIVKYLVEELNFDVDAMDDFYHSAMYYSVSNFGVGEVSDYIARLWGYDNTQSLFDRMQLL